MNGEMEQSWRKEREGRGRKQWEKKRMRRKRKSGVVVGKERAKLDLDVKLLRGL